MGRDPDDEGPAGRRRPPPDRRAGPPRDLSERAERFVARASAVDRRARHQLRREEVAEIRRIRRRRQLAVAVTAGGSTVIALIVVGGLVGGTTGAMIGAGLAVLVAVGVLLARSFAERRGASAWDWQLQRHRLIGDPSERVRASDDPRHRSGS